MEVDHLQTRVAELEARNAVLEARNAAPQGVLMTDPPTADTVIYHRSIQDTILALFTSRKFLLLLMDMVISLLLYYNAVDPIIIGILQPPFWFVIGGIAYEDGAEKSAPVNVQTQNVNPEQR